MGTSERKKERFLKNEEEKKITASLQKYVKKIIMWHIYMYIYNINIKHL